MDKLYEAKAIHYIGGTANSGKSNRMVNLSVGLAKEDKTVLFISTEMNLEELINRFTMMDEDVTKLDIELIHIEMGNVIPLIEQSQGFDVIMVDYCESREMMADIKNVIVDDTMVIGALQERTT